jgi:hypothetical protein
MHTSVRGDGDIGAVRTMIKSPVIGCKEKWPTVFFRSTNTDVGIALTSRRAKRMQDIGDEIPTQGYPTRILIVPTLSLQVPQYRLNTRSSLTTSRPGLGQAGVGPMAVSRTSIGRMR